MQALPQCRVIRVDECTSGCFLQGPYPGLTLKMKAEFMKKPQDHLGSWGWVVVLKGVNTLAPGGELLIANNFEMARYIHRNVGAGRDKGEVAHKVAGNGASTARAIPVGNNVVHS